MELRVDPSQAVLLVDGQTVSPHDGRYTLTRALLRSGATVTPTLHAAGYGDVALPPLSKATLKSYQPGGPYRLPVQSLPAAFHRYPWVFALLGVGLVVGGVAMMWPRHNGLSDDGYYAPPEVLTAETVRDTPVDPLLGSSWAATRSPSFSARAAWPPSTKPCPGTIWWTATRWPSRSFAPTRSPRTSNSASSGKFASA